MPESRPRNIFAKVCEEMKRTIASILTLCMLVTTLLSPAALAVEMPLAQDRASGSELSGSCGDELTWRIDENDVLTVSGDGSMQDYDPNSAGILQGYGRNVSKVVVEEGVTSIGANAFGNLMGTGTSNRIESLSIPSTVTNIGEGALPYNYLQTVTVAQGNPVYYVRDGVLFSKSDAQTKLVYYPPEKEGDHYQVPDGVTEISGLIPAQCMALKSIHLPASLREIVPDGLVYWRNLSNITVDNQNTVYCAQDGVLFDRDKTTLVKYPSEKSGEHYMIPNTVTKIAEDAFFGAHHLTSVDIPQGVTVLDEAAFNGCYNLQKVSIPEGVTKLGAWAFGECEALSSVTIPSTVEEIGDYAFLYTNFKSVSLPRSLQRMGTNPFYESALTDIYYAGSEAEWSQIEFEYLDLTEITVHFGDESSAEGDILLNHTSLTVQQENSFQLQALDTNGASVTWASSDTGVATVDQSGQVTAVAAGEAVITASVTVDGVTDTATCTVTVPGVVFEEQRVYMAADTCIRPAYKAYPENADLIWNSSAESVAQVDRETGAVTALNGGTARVSATITMADSNGQFFTQFSAYDVEVLDAYLEETTLIIHPGETEYEPLCVNYIPSGHILELRSEDPQVASVPNSGEVGIRGEAMGTTTVYYDIKVGGRTILSLPCRVIVPGIQLEKPELSLRQLESVTLEPAVFPADADVTWNSSEETVASVTTTGLVTAISPGETVITGTMEVEGRTYSQQCTVTVYALEDLADIASYIKEHGEKIYSPQIGADSYDMYRFDRIHSGDDGIWIEDGDDTFYLLDQDDQLVTDPEVLIQAEFLQRFNGDTGFANTDRYREDWNLDAFLANDRLMREIHGSMMSVFDAYYLADIATELYNFFSNTYKLDNISVAFWAMQDSYDGIYEAAEDLVDQCLEIQKGEITTLEYLYAQTIIGLEQLEDSRDMLFENALHGVSESSPFVSSYYDAKSIEQYSVLQSQNQCLHPLVLKYFRNPVGYDDLLSGLAWIIGYFPDNEINEYEEKLEEWLGELPEPLRGSMQEKMWFTKKDGPDGKALLALDRDQIKDPDFLEALEEIERLGEEYQKLLFPITGENEVGNLALLQEMEASYPDFSQVVAIHCPVNVEVYSSNELIASTTSNIPYNEENPIILLRDGQETTLVFPRDRNYKITITAFDDGIMQYMEWETHPDGGTNLKSIPLEESDVFSVNASGMTAPDYSQIQKDDEEIRVSVTVSASDGGNVVGGGDYVKGAPVALAAIPQDGYRFAGWYVGSSKVGTETAYSFKADTDCSVRAEFEATSEPVSFTAVQTGGVSGTSDSAGIVLKFDHPVEGLLKRDISASGNTGAVIGTPICQSEDKTTWVVPLSSVRAEGELTLRIEDFGVYDFNNQEQVVTIYKEKTTASVSGGSSSSDPSYSPKLDVSDGGTIKVSPRTPSEDDKVTITVTPDEGYELDKLTVTDRNGREIDVTAERDGTYTFIQPRGRVTIETTFAEIVEEPDALPFLDVPTDAYYYDAVAWAVENGVTGGTSATTFSPDNACTRAQMVTFLWRAAGSPEPETTVNPFTDVSADAYYYEAVLWAVENGITNGTSATTFGPDATVTRSQTVTFLWRNAGSPVVAGTGFADVSADAYYASAVAWAAREGITSGTSTTTFSPDNACTRAQIVTFLYRELAE